MKIWYVDFPTFQYEEDVKALAKEGGLKILDSKFDAGDGESSVPALTKKTPDDGPAENVAPDETPEQTATDNESDAEEAEAETASNNHTLMVEHFRASGITKQPKVGDVESELGIDTNGKAIAAALKEALAIAEKAEDPE